MRIAGSNPRLLAIALLCSVATACSLDFDAAFEETGPRTDAGMSGGASGHDASLGGASGYDGSIVAPDGDAGSSGDAAMDGAAGSTGGADAAGIGGGGGVSGSDGGAGSSGTGGGGIGGSSGTGGGGIGGSSGTGGGGIGGSSGTGGGGFGGSSGTGGGGIGGSSGTGGGGIGGSSGTGGSGGSIGSFPLPCGETGVPDPCASTDLCVDLGHISLWPGKVNNHTTSTGQWEVDPDCTSGAELHDAAYCAKFYPEALYSVHLTAVSPGVKTFYSAGCSIPAPGVGFDEYACVVCASP